MFCLPWEREGRCLSDEQLLEAGRGILRSEAAEIERAANRVGMELVKAARIIHSCRGRLVVAGMGKSGIIGRKIAATLASLGTPSFFLHAAEGSHGDLGMVCRDDAALILSNSGTTAEVVSILPHFRQGPCPNSTPAIISQMGAFTSLRQRCSRLCLSPALSLIAEGGADWLASALSARVGLHSGSATVGTVARRPGFEFTCSSRSDSPSHAVRREHHVVRQSPRHLAVTAVVALASISESGKAIGVAVHQQGAASPLYRPYSFR